MKQFYLLLCIMFSSILQSQIITIPDANFKAKLLQSNTSNMIAYDLSEHSILLDANANGEIEVSEVQNVYGLNINNSGISDLTGISSFVNLKGINCAYNSLTSMVIDNSILLSYLNASHNTISVFSVVFENEVYSLDLSYNNLTSFTASSNIYWDLFDVSHNQLTTMVFNDAMVHHSNISFNNLTQVQFVGNVQFVGSGNFTHNQFTLLDLSDATFANNFTIVLGYNQQDVVFFDNSLQPSNIEYSSNNTTFDAGNFNRTNDCDPENTGNVIITNSPNLQTIIFKNGYNHTELTCNEGGTIFQIPSMDLQISNCPNLNHVCVDGIELPYIQSTINLLGLQNQVQVNTNCTSSIVLETDVFASDEPFTISPVPTKYILQITASDSFAINGLEVVNNLGQVVQSEIGSSYSIDVSNLAKGSYILKIKSDETIYFKHFLKE